jgi:hypothetical protein
VLYVDRDNPPRLIRDRLRCIGVAGAENLRLLTRVDAPPLTDRNAWLALPWQDYDVIIVDSLGAATEGVSEKEGKQTQQFLATLKDLVQRGLALVALDNTIKAGTHYRGRGEKADAIDILYECRDVTNWTPTTEAWWEALPEAGITPGRVGPVVTARKRTCGSPLWRANSGWRWTPSPSSWKSISGAMSGPCAT